MAEAQDVVTRTAGRRFSVFCCAVLLLAAHVEPARPSQAADGPFDLCRRALMQTHASCKAGLSLDGACSELDPFDLCLCNLGIATIVELCGARRSMRASDLP